MSDSQRAVLAALLAAHPRMLERDELEARLPYVERLDQAVQELRDDGLVNRLGDLVGASRAAVRFKDLGA